MSIVRFRRHAIRCGVLLALMLLAPATDVLGRGGSQQLRWGYHSPAGNPWVNMWAMTNIWSAMSGGAIPHRNLGAPDLNMGSPRGSRNSGQSGGSLVAPRSTSTMHSSRMHAAATTTYLPTTVYPVPDRPYASDSRFQPAYSESYDSYWHHGYWGGGQWGWERWDDELGLWSFPRWSGVELYFPSGYGLYRNPFQPTQEGQSPSFLDYSTPIDRGVEQPPATSTSRNPQEKSPEELFQEAQRDLLKSPEATAGLKAFDAARDAFRAKNYDLALQKSEEALRSLPRDPALHEFRGLVQFARGEYRQSAAVIYAVLSVSPGWDWTTLSGLYANHDDYTSQLRALETYRKEHPQSVEAAFLSAYHYATCRHNESAVKQLRNVVKSLPNDELAPHLLTLLAGADDVPESAAGPLPAPSQPSPADTAPPPERKELAGVWRAQRGSAGIELTLEEDGRFVWVVNREGRVTRLEGTYRFEEGQLALFRGRAMMLGVVNSRPGGFRFRLIENDPPTQGIDFSR